jgi:hypothetical protein
MGLRQIINRSLSDIEYVRSLQGRLGCLVTEAYIRCLGYTHGMDLLHSVFKACRNPILTRST